MMNCIFSYECDEFLVRLNAALLPTLNQGSVGDCTVYVPIFSNSSNISWNASNPFEISSFALDYDLVSGFIFIMRNTKHCKSLLLRSLIEIVLLDGLNGFLIGTKTTNAVLVSIWRKLHYR